MKKIATTGQTWRADLKVGDMVDVLTRADERCTHKGWMQAKIVEAYDEALRLEYVDTSDWFDCHIDRNAVELAQFETRTKDDYAWRASKLEQWTEIDCTALHCTVMQCNALLCPAMHCNAMQCEAP